MRFYTFVLKNVFRRRVRSLLTMTGLAVAVAAVVALVGISDGFSRTMLELYQRRGVSLIVSRSDAVNPLGGLIDEKLGKEIASLEGVADVCPGLVDVLSFENLQLNNIVTQGWPPGAYMFSELNVLQGECLTEKSHGQHLLMLGKDLAANAKLKVGDKVQLTDEGFRVAGVYETFAGMENNMVILLLEDAQRVLGKPRQITGCSVKVNDMSPEGVEKVKAQIEGEVAAKLHLKGKIKATAPADLVQSSMQMKMARAMAWVTSAIALVISTIFVLTVMIMSVFERTREIGILRAIGWRPWRVMRMILTESVLLSVGGGIVGTAGGIGLILLLSRLPQVNGLIEGRISPDIILKAFVIALLVGLVGAAYPAYRGARLLPTEAIRHE